MPDYNSGGFHQGEDGAIFGNPDGTNSGSVTDYENWDWKQIKAAVYGMSSGVGTAANLAHARSIANPQSLMDAANAFLDIQRILEAVTKSLLDQAKALAGDHGPWGGSAADAFLTMMTNFSRQVKANADVLAGGSTGDHSIPHQLANNAISFQSAQNKLAEIDVWYAHQAVLMGVTPMSDGLIPISHKPELVAMMTEDMRAVLKNLAHSYQVTSDAVVNPTPVTSPTNNPDGSGNDGDGDGPDLRTADLDGSGAGTGDTGSLSDLSGYPDTGLEGGTATGDGIGDVGDLAGLNASADPAAYPGDLSGLDDTGLDPSGLDGTGLGDLGLDGLDPAGIDTALNPVSFPDLAALGGLGSLAGLGGSGLGSEGESSLGGLSSADPAAFGDTGLGDGIADGLTDGLGSGLTDGLSTGSPAQLATSSGMPYMPGMGGTGAGGAGLTSEPTDASGLLDASADPWEGEETPGGDEVGSELGAAAGGEGLSASGMPYMPGMGGVGASNAGRDGTNERTDASGLLDPSTEPWASDDETDDEAGSLTGAPPGVPFLPGFGTTGPGTGAGTGRANARADERTQEAAPAEEGSAEQSEATAEAPVAIGSDGLPLPAAVPDADSAVAPQPSADDGEEDFSAWEPGAGAGAFVPLLWAVGGDREREPEHAAGESGEPRSTWQPDRTGDGPVAGVSTGALGVAFCGDGGPEPEEPEEEVEEEPEEEPAPRGIADLLVQPESTWGAVPGDSAAAL
ncbi:WXG100 family type VII secretion target [Streptomyces sp. cg40]|uniref:WXG100 family type VII secretion target n=1 Tax=Streptomyces sp. cg40 TaxID=3419764 RepID=UPI003D02F8A4